MKRPRGWLLDASAAALLCAVVVALTWRIGLAGRVLAAGDVFSYFYPYWAEATRAIRALRLPGWNPGLFMGVPLAANSQVGFFYPFNWPLWLLLPAHRAVHVSIVLHLCLAAVNAYSWGRRGLGLGRFGSATVGAIFGLGGYVIAQMEHVNQLQGLAWLPLLLTLTHDVRRPQRQNANRRTPQDDVGRDSVLRAADLRAAAAMALVIGLILLAGHTQTAFISLLGTALYAAGPGLWRPARGGGARLLRSTIILFVLAATLGVGVAGVQLLPTWQLAQHSVRAQGLPFNERVSFSLSPLYMGRALLPPIRTTVPAEHLEHVAYVGVAGLVMALLALVMDLGRGREGRTLDIRGQFGPYALTLLGLFFALGLYNPLYVLLARYVPGFAHFRVPARWLMLYAVGVAGLAGRTVDRLWQQGRPGKRHVFLSLVLIFLLIGWAIAGTRLEAGGGETGVWFIGWAVAALGAGLLLLAGGRRPRVSAIGLAGLVAVELFVAAGALPQARATASQAFTSIRPAIAHLLASETSGPEPLDRYISLSDTMFDPGDLALIGTIYGPQLSDAQLYEYIVATKKKEVLSPNLSLAFGVPALDGYGGGVLPLERYVMLQHAFVSPEEVSIDGRLRENLLQVPDGRWLSLFNVRYVITDKLRDAWVDDVFYDLQFGARLSAGELASVPEIPPFEATALGVVSHADGLAAEAEGATAGVIEIVFSDGTSRSFKLAVGMDVPLGAGEGLADEATRIRWLEAALPISITVEAVASDGEWVVRGLSLIDERTGSFQSLVLSDRGRYRLVHSGDVKIYENLDVLPRVVIVPRARAVSEDAEALEVLRDPGLDLSSEIVLSAPGPSRCCPSRSTAAADPTASARITEYGPERVVVDATLSQPGYLLLTDAYFPGWQATVNGEPRAICRADILFRAMPLGPGEHHVVFSFRPPVQRLGAAVSLLSIVLVGLMAYKGELSKA